MLAKAEKTKYSFGTLVVSTATVALVTDRVFCIKKVAIAFLCDSHFNYFRLQKQNLIKRINDSMIIITKTTAKQIPMVINIAKYQLYNLVNTIYKMDIATYMMKPTITSNQVLSPPRLSAPIHLSKNFNDFILIKLHI